MWINLSKISCSSQKFDVTQETLTWAIVDGGIVGPVDLGVVFLRELPDTKRHDVRELFPSVEKLANFSKEIDKTAVFVGIQNNMASTV